jgi:hypothetical protein
MADYEPSPKPSKEAQSLYWTIDLVIEMKLAGCEVTPGMQRLLPLLAAAVWALDRHAEPMPDDIVRRYDVSRATAYRWLRKIRSARTELQALRSEPA